MCTRETRAMRQGREVTRSLLPHCGAAYGVLLNNEARADKSFFHQKRKKYFLYHISSDCAELG